MGGQTDTARLIYLGILAAVTITYFLSDFRNRLNQSLQLAAIWGLIFLAAIAAYSFRDVISGEIFSSSPRLAAGGELSIRRQGDGHFYMNLQVNGRDVTFVIDTGATDIVLTQGDAKRVGIDLARLEFIGEASTANGRVQTAEVFLDSLAAPGIILNDVRVSVNGGPLDASLLGMAFLNRFQKIAIEGDLMVLTP